MKLRDGTTISEAGLATIPGDVRRRSTLQNSVNRGLSEFSRILLRPGITDGRNSREFRDWQEFLPHSNDLAQLAIYINSY